MIDLPADGGFSDEQKQYLDGFVSGSTLVQSLHVPPTWQTTLGLPEQPRPAPNPAHDANTAAQDRALAEGKKLCAEEQAKRKLNGLDTWDLVLEHARDARFPKGTDVFMMKFQGLFYVAPAQDSFMCRLRLPGGFITAAQLRGVADLAERFGGGYADVTTRANLQVRQIGPKHTVDLLMGLHELGIVNRGAGADNIRNITCSPTAGIDPQEICDTRDLARQMHHYILNHRAMYGLPRKFNIAFDGGGAISALDDTNDIGFTATRLKNRNVPFLKGAFLKGDVPIFAEEDPREPATPKKGTVPILPLAKMGTVPFSPLAAVRERGAGACFPLGVGFRLTLGGITGHKDFARDTGIMLTPDECVPVAAAIVKAFVEHGDRTDRKKARLKYVLDRMGFDGFIEQVEKHHGAKLRRVPLELCEPRPAVAKHGHIGFHAQKQPGLHYVGVALPVGRMSCEQMRQLAQIAERHGSGTIRLTVWQNLLISDIPADRIDEVKRDIEEAGLSYSATSIRGGVVACTGNAGCRFAAADTKLHARQIADYLEPRIELDQPINIHLTGCHHSCAQHFIGDIGLLATKVSVGEDMVEGYHVYVGGGYGEQQGIGREIYRDVVAADAPAVIERLLRAYLAERQSPQETFLQFARRLPTDALVNLCDAEGVLP